ncbi:hypothetical protein Rleg_5433 (plasmid) [Rhizobium leguminosarum bv. trifolii WSM1325]|uniref:Uncharacterized protein n=1 Tax=Rhizobium leguminosarum bv. trifolii (strain WSM1325) TaxID=395491 RepID=C6B8M0_RHILS|nr:hypothetical protein Rleg_5433 [Rhizobium leguminosarum bv. trifolii WSM1325]
MAVGFGKNSTILQRAFTEREEFYDDVDVKEVAAHWVPRSSLDC